MEQRHEANEYILELEHITKTFPGVRALDDVSLQLKKGEVLALVGENGAGKSTLINCVTGVYHPDSGIIKKNGERVQIRSTADAFNKGISVVHQERNLIDTFDVAENIFFERICGKAWSGINRKAMHEDVKPYLKRLNLDMNPYDSIEGMSAAQLQMIEIARALTQNADLLLLDEPTSSISIRETELLLDTIRDLRNQGMAIIYITHKLEEVFAIADKVKVIRDGREVGEVKPIGELTRDDIIEMMVGSREAKISYESHSRENAPVVIDAVDISSADNPYPNSFHLRKGEILGWYGLVGSGRTELAREIIGIDPITNGQLSINGEPVKINTYKKAFRKYSIYYVSEDRKEEGLFLSHSVSANIAIVVLDKLRGFLKMHSYKKEYAATKKYADILQIKMSSPHVYASSLSGGNQQKVCVAKCLITEPDIIIFDEPTVGIDVKTKAEIHRLIYQLSQEGKSIILISSDMTELVQIAERVEVFNGGYIVGDLENTKNYDDMSRRIMKCIQDADIKNASKTSSVPPQDAQIPLSG